MLLQELLPGGNVICCGGCLGIQRIVRAYNLRQFKLAKNVAYRVVKQADRLNFLVALQLLFLGFLRRIVFCHALHKLIVEVILIQPYGGSSTLLCFLHPIGDFSFLRCNLANLLRQLLPFSHVLIHEVTHGSSVCLHISDLRLDLPNALTSIADHALQNCINVHDVFL